MARGGINKVLVKQARESLLSKGQNPSIDAIEVRPAKVLDLATSPATN